MKQALSFVTDSYEELKKVQWPSRQQTTRLTGYVVGLSFVVGVFAMVFDDVFKTLLTLLVTR